ncbi:3-isopropylmalate dehydrogenase [Micromonospora chalcea]|uniref:3-isopropylmalate dehydrogenase n=1 Tax=Micromonospora chalcea TaxID=1874 RepID=UPI00157E0665|nr:3-isopropylmalate dehydrogenase [Micromonospora chalcea]
MSAQRIALVPGDGIGPEVTAQAVKACDAAAQRFGLDLVWEDYELGADYWRITGQVVPPDVERELAKADAILFGAVGDPSVPPGVLERGLVIHLRTAFDQYVNLRPVKLLPGVPSPIGGLRPEQCDLVILRENTEGAYVGAGGFIHRGSPDEIATQESVNTRKGVERLIRHGFRLALTRRKHVTLVHKANILTYAGDLWQRTFEEVAAEYPEISVEYVHVDAMCLYLVTQPERFDVVVTDNLFGDIITDLGAAVQGGLGLAASGNLNPTGSAPSMFEPVHGSAPDIAGRGWANPAGSILSAALMLEHLGHPEAARSLEDGVKAVLPRLGAMRGPEMGMSTEDFGDAVAAAISEGAYQADALPA